MGSLTYPSRSKNTTGTTGFRYNLPPLGHSNKHKKFEKWLKKQNSGNFTLISKQKKNELWATKSASGEKFCGKNKIVKIKIQTYASWSKNTTGTAASLIFSQCFGGTKKILPK